jgi:hypothetical protein
MDEAQITNLDCPAQALGSLLWRLGHLQHRRTAYGAPLPSGSFNNRRGGMNYMSISACRYLLDYV